MKLDCDRPMSPSSPAGPATSGTEGRSAFAPRFVPHAPSRLAQTVTEARASGCLIHTHASENKDEVELVRELTGQDNVAI